MKPRMHLVEISSFSLNIVTVRLTKIMNNILERSFFSVKNWPNLPPFFLIEEYWTRRPTFDDKYFWKFGFLKYILYFLKLCPIFVGSEVVRSSLYQIGAEFTHLYTLGWAKLDLWGFGGESWCIVGGLHYAKMILT